MKNKNLRVVTAALPLDLIDRIEAIGERLERSKSWMIKCSLYNWVSEEEMKQRIIESEIK